MSRGFQATAPATFRELERWRKQGLLAFKSSDDLDRVVARVLKAVREHLVQGHLLGQEGEGSPPESPS